MEQFTNNVLAAKRKVTSLPAVKWVLSHEVICALLLFFVLWGGFMAYSGTLTSGYHLIDDHEMLTIRQDLSQGNLLNVTEKWIQSDLHARFRPMYYIQRVFSIWVLGTNFEALSLMTLVMAAVTTWLLYLFARKIGFGRLTSFFFVFLTLLGTQSTIWWRLGPTETIGMFWFAIGMLYMAKAVFDKSKKLNNTIVAVAALLLASLSKEAFVILLPAIVFWWLLLYMRHNNVNFWKALKANLAVVIIFAITCAAELAVIFLKVGTTGIGYAGTDSKSLTISKLLVTLKQLSLQSHFWLVVFLGVVLVTVLGYKFIKSSGSITAKLRRQRSLIIELALVGVLFLGIVGSQAVLYAKSGIYERYLLPGTIGIAFLAVFLMTLILRIITNKSLKLVVTIVIILATLVSLRSSYAAARLEAKQFTTEGAEVNQALNDIATHTQPNDVILLVADPAIDFEAGVSTQDYLNIQAERPHVYFYLQKIRVYETPFLEELAAFYPDFIGKANLTYLEDKSQIKAVFTYKETDAAFQKAVPSWIDMSKFERHDFGRFITYIAK